jgi:hypothetical protein
MDLHQGGGATTGSYPQEQPSSATPSPSHFQQPRHHTHQHQLYNLLPPPPPPPPQPSYSPTITLPPISTNTNSQYNDQESWPRSRDLHQVYQPQQSNIKRETMGKHIDASSHARNADDPMPSTSDFVKKLYKFVFFSFKYHLLPSLFCIECWKILRFRISSLGDHWVTVSLSKYCRFLPYPLLVTHPFGRI